MNSDLRLSVTQELLYQSIHFHGADTQRQKAAEECAELIQALMKYQLRVGSIRKVAEEVADVQIMAEQLELMIGGGLVAEFRFEKLQRLARRMEGLE